MAEGAAFVICSHLGIEMPAYAFGYISGWAWDKAVLRHNLEAIQRPASVIIQRLHRTLDPTTRL